MVPIFLGHPVCNYRCIKPVPVTNTARHHGANKNSAGLSPTSITPTSPNLPRDTCEKSATCHREVADMDHVTNGEVTGMFQGVSSLRDMSRWSEKFPRQVGNKPVCVVEMGKSATSRTDQRGRHGCVAVADLSRTSWGNRNSGI